MSEKKKSLQYLSGMHAAIPVILGFVPVGIAYAIMARQAGFSVLQTCGMSLADYERMRCKPNAEGHNKNQAVGSFWGNG